MHVSARRHRVSILACKYTTNHRHQYTSDLRQGCAAFGTGAGGNSYAHDANVNQVEREIARQTYTLGYDAENHLVNVAGPSLSASFVYDGDWRRVRSTVNGVTTTFVNA